jgi:hypothetical protein
LPGTCSTTPSSSAITRLSSRGSFVEIATLLRRIDDYAKRHGESRSGFLTRAAVQAMGSEGGPGP